jgi:hypothetical protein
MKESKSNMIPPDNPTPRGGHSFLRVLEFIAGLIVVTGGAFLIQVRIDHMTSGFVHGALLAVSGLVEVGLASVWSGMLN